MVNNADIEAIFFRVLDDLEEYLGELTLVGGWLSYVYPKFVWNNLNVNPVTTVDVDFGVSSDKPLIHKQTIFQILSSRDYTERHLSMDRMYPVVLFKEGKVRVDFISGMDIPREVVERLVGSQMSISRLKDFDFILDHRIKVNVENKKSRKTYALYCPRPAAYIYHKAATFVEREDDLKCAKDLFYIYFVLRYAPDVADLLKEVHEFFKAGHLPQAAGNLKKYFERKSGRGCLMVDKENGPDGFVEDLRTDIFERFSALREQLL
ncbi:MAG: hypothetical protein HQL22_09680 [Candidatus Omnitrophica bacterium]|nr:hypothetical protein [Candidatus Omnitrophota bacterium]